MKTMNEWITAWLADWVNLLSAGCVVTLRSTMKTTPSCLNRSWKPTTSLTHRTGTTYRTQVSLSPLPPPLSCSPSASLNILPPSSPSSFVHHMVHMDHRPPLHHGLWCHPHGMNVFRKVCVCGIISHHPRYVWSLPVKSACFSGNPLQNPVLRVCVFVDGDKIAFSVCVRWVLPVSHILQILFAIL